mmetsp:Transcript_8802/g.23087  ORF Transcript_8802/g.23087 Transcript_8802/m.23087 type:complete len:93 (+) Transcript_8802:1131-1409(+)
MRTMHASTKLDRAPITLPSSCFRNSSGMYGISGDAAKSGPVKKVSPRTMAIQAMTATVFHERRRASGTAMDAAAGIQTIAASPIAAADATLK